MAKKVKSPEEIRKDAIETARIVEDAFRSISSRMAELFGEARDEAEDITAGLVKDVEKGLKGLLSNAEAIADANEKAAKGLYKQRDVQKEIEKKSKAIFILETKIAEAKANGAKNTAEMQKELDKIKESSAEFEENLQGAADRSKNITKAMGLTGVALKGMKKVAGTLGLDGIEDIMSDASGAAADMSKELTKSGQESVGMMGKLKIAFAGISSAAGGIVEALTDPLVLIGLLVKAVKFLADIFDHVQKTTNKIGQSLGIAGANAKALKHEIHAAGDAGGDMYYFTDEMVDNYIALNKAAGMNLKFNKENAKTFQDMTLYMGVSQEQAAGLFKIATETGVPFSQIYDTTVDTVNALDQASNFSSDMGSIMEAMTTASSSVRYNIKGGAEGLVKAAHTANRLGLSMDEIAAAAETHLDFESSIAKEIEAEMYLQKDLNLDKLRYAALTGDTATAAAEEERLIKENMKSLKGNVLAQEAFAAATGISRDRLNDVMANQERIKKLTPQQLKDEKAKSEEMAKQGKKAQAFDRAMQSAMLQLKAALTPIAETLGPVLIKGAEFIGNFIGSPAGKTLLAVAGLVATGAIIAKIGSSIKNFFTGGMLKKGSRMNPMYTWNLNEQGGGGMDNNITRYLKGNVFKYLGKKGGLSRTLNRTMIRTFGKNGFTRMMQTKVFNPLGKMNTKFGSSLNNLFGKIIPSSGANLEKAFGTNQMNKIQKMAETGRNMKGQFISKAQQSKAGNMVSKFMRPGAGSSLTQKAAGLLPKGVTTTLSKAGPLLTKTLKVLGPVGVALDAGIGGFTGYSQAQMSAEEQKAAGVKENISTGEAIAQGILTGGAEKGSSLSKYVGIEKGSGGDEAMGVLGSAGRGAAIGATIGSIIPGVGTAIGAGVGALVGGVSESFKLLTNPDSQLRKGLASMGEGIADFASDTASTIGGWASSAGESISSWASSAGETIGGWASSAGETISGWAGSAMDTMSGWASSAGEGISSFFSSVGSGVSSLASGAADLASEAGAYLSDTVSSIGSSIANSSVGKAASSVYNAVAESSWNPVNWFAEGGVVTKPMIGGVGEAGPEAIIPLSQAGNVLGGAEVTKLLKELIAEVRKGGDVYLDGSKVGHSLALQSSKMG